MGAASDCLVERPPDADAPGEPTAPHRALERQPPLLAYRLRRRRRPRLWEEVLFIGLSYVLYSLIRNGVPTHEVGARNRAEALYGVERALHMDIELAINHAVASVHWLSLAADYWYAIAHFVVTLAVLGWLYVRHPLRYRSARSVLLATNLIALVGFWDYSLAPPRMLAAHGFVDTVLRDQIWGSWGTSGMAAASNQYAAMPSLHIGWALWSGIVVLALARRRWVRAAGVIYPCTTLLVILGTANHFLLDAAGGALALGCGFAISRMVSGRPALAGSAARPVNLPLDRRRPA